MLPKTVKIKDYLSILKDAFRNFNNKDPLRLGAATAFFTIFALPMILLLLITIFGWIFEAKQIKDKFFSRLDNIIGTSSMEQVESIFNNIRKIGEQPLTAILGFLFMIFVSTTLFLVVQNSINDIWNIKYKFTHKFRSVLLDRAISFLIILFSGILVLAELMTSSGLAFINNHLEEFGIDFNVGLFQLINYLLGFGVNVLWFAILFKFLPNAKMKWKVVWTGAFLTAFLFNIGKWILGELLINSNISDIYGAAGAIVLVLLFVFYSSFILYYGAAFVKAYAEKCGFPVRPKIYAIEFEVREKKPKK